MSIAWPWMLTNGTSLMTIHLVHMICSWLLMMHARCLRRVLLTFLTSRRIIGKSGMWSGILLIRRRRHLRMRRVHIWSAVVGRLQMRPRTRSGLRTLTQSHILVDGCVWGSRKRCVYDTLKRCARIGGCTVGYVGFTGLALGGCVRCDAPTDEY